MNPGSKCPTWHQTLAPFAVPSAKRGVLAIATSAIPYIALCVVMYLTLGISPVLTGALAILTAGFLVRVFVMFHDCVHGSLMPSRRANTMLGGILGLMVLTPFRRWRHGHAVHHATSGDLDRRGVGDVFTLTVAEYRARTWGSRIGYRLFRNPLVMFGLGPAYAMFLMPRFVPRGARRATRDSVLATDAALAAIVGGLCWLIGWQDLLLVWVLPALLAGAIGGWLFYVQHQFENAYWQRRSTWDFTDAALRGSSHLKLPAVLRFFTGSIGLHHVHHLNTRIPNYHLGAAHNANPIFVEVPTLSIWDGLRAVRFKLWDEESGRLVTFAEARRDLENLSLSGAPDLVGSRFPSLGKTPAPQ